MFSSSAARQAAQRLPRTYFTAAARAIPAASNPRMNVALATAAVVAVGAYGYYLRQSNVAHADDGRTPTSKVFSGFPPLKKLTLQSAEMVNHDTKRLRFGFADQDAVSGLGIATATLTVSFPNGGWKPVPRPYTPVSLPSEKGHIDFLIKHYPGGAASTHMHSLKPGDSVRFLALPSFYTWAPNKHPHVALIAGGAGITPLWSLTQGILTNPADKTRITLVWGVNGDRDLFLKEEFADLERRFPDRFRTVYAVSKPEAGSKHTPGYVTAELLRKAGIAPAGEETKVLVCGPPAMETALLGKRGSAGILGELGFNKKQIHKF